MSNHDWPTQIHEQYLTVIQERDDAIRGLERIREYAEKRREWHPYVETIFLIVEEALDGVESPPPTTTILPTKMEMGVDSPDFGGMMGTSSNESREPFSGLADVYENVLPSVNKFVQENGRLPVDLAEATNEPQEPPAKGDDR